MPEKMYILVMVYNTNKNTSEALNRNGIFLYFSN